MAISNRAALHISSPEGTVEPEMTFPLLVEIRFVGFLLEISTLKQASLYLSSLDETFR